MAPILPDARFAELVREHHAAVYRSARRIAADEAQALDVTQQVYLRVLEGKVALGQARDSGRLLCWLAARTALAARRGARTRAEKEQRIAMDPMQTDTDAEPAQGAERRETRAELARLVAGLPEELRTAIVLRFQEQWTFAEIAEAQAISEPSAHDRVRRALERLRGGLSRAGFAAVAVDLPRELARGDLAPTVVPGGLEQSLLLLRAPLAAATTAKLGAAAAALLSIVALASAAVWWPDPRGTAPAEAAALVTPVEPAGNAPEPGPGARGNAANATGIGDGRVAVTAESAGRRAEGGSGEADEPPRGTIVGRFLDAERAPVAGVVVHARSLQYGGKFARFDAVAVSGNDGAFELEVPVSLESGEHYSFVTRHLDFLPHEHGDVVARANQATELGAIELLRGSHDAPGDSRLEVTVLGPDGRPVPRAEVSSWRTIVADAPASTGSPREDREALGTTDASGRVVLELARLGKKRLRVQPPAGTLGPATLEFAIEVAGAHARTVTLSEGLVISGTVIGIGGPVIHGQGGFVGAYLDDGSAWIQGDVDDATGAFVVRGLADREYTLVRGGDEWSRVERRGVRAGTTGLVLELKRGDDARDLGDHMAELHGELRDAATGAVLEIEEFSMRVEGLEDEGGDWQRDVRPGLVFPRPVQTASWGEYAPPKSFHLDGLRPGRYAITARLAGYGVAFAGPFELREGEIVRGLVIPVSRPAKLSGVLVDAAGRAVSGGFVRVTGFGPLSSARDVRADEELRATRGRGAIGVWDDVAVGQDGRFELTLPAGVTLRLALHHPEHAFAYTERIELAPGETRDLGRATLGPVR